MAAIDDLKAAVTTMSTAVADAATELKTLAQTLANSSGDVNSADVEAAAAQINTLAGNLEAAVQSAQPAPTVPTTPTNPTPSAPSAPAA